MGIMARQRREIWYQGHVQGVGFRYNVAHLARRFDVAGYVRNLADGRVQLVCEGEDDQVESLVAAIAERMEGCIQDTQQDRRPAAGEFVSFEIRY